MKKLILILCLLIISSNIKSQDVKADLLKANQEFDKTDNISLNIFFNFYCSTSSKNAEESKVSKLFKYNNNVLIEGLGITTFIDKDITLIINDNNKTLQIQKTSKKITLSDLNLSISKIIEYSDKTTFSETSDEKIYQLEINKLGVKKMIIHINKNNFHINSIEYYHYGSIENGKSVSKNCTNPVSKIIFKYNNNFNFDKGRLFLDNYILLQKSGTYSPVKKYVKYKIINKIKKVKK